MLCDADMCLVVHDPNWKQALSADVYLVKQICDGELSYRNIRLVNARLNGDRRWRYWGVTHEYCGSVRIGYETKPEFFDQIEFLDHADGGTRAGKLDRDAELLERELELAYDLEQQAIADPSNFAVQSRLTELKHMMPRNLFYLAQTYRDMGRCEDSLEVYEHRVALGGWDQETWQALYEIAKLSERLGRDESAVLTAFLRAYEFRPSRVEPLVELARYFRERNRHHLAYIFAQRAKDFPLPTDTHFLHPSFFGWRALDEYAIASYWVGDWQASVRACQQLLDGRDLPKEHRGRIATNLENAREAISSAGGCRSYDRS
jgi:tetratricopeptide (TPR) repeat protein